MSSSYKSISTIAKRSWCVHYTQKCYIDNFIGNFMSFAYAVSEKERKILLMAFKCGMNFYSSCRINLAIPHYHNLLKNRPTLPNKSFIPPLKLLQKAFFSQKYTHHSTCDVVTSTKGPALCKRKD